ncbi:hypothetical protein BCR34DRAFT_297954 [Clohesyomyces aquaticus]|uniref:Uncharacterized protein n=1 Tax=Clohesyomyces aquaticus TaxID=1231657 RepID=A0A1Y1ZR85_9PLEO|nr:hypothetical protein BCR34DRAFT_297954 [Clohesyomyces aquaticus]
MESVQAHAHPTALPIPSQSPELRRSLLHSESPTPSEISDSEYETAEEYLTYPTPPDPIIESMVGRIPRGLDALGLEFQGIAAGLRLDGWNERGRTVRLRKNQSGGLRAEVGESEEVCIAVHPSVMRWLSCCAIVSSGARTCVCKWQTGQILTRDLGWGGTRNSAWKGGRKGRLLATRLYRLVELRAPSLPLQPVPTTSRRAKLELLR